MGETETFVSDSIFVIKGQPLCTTIWRHPAKHQKDFIPIKNTAKLIKCKEESNRSSSRRVTHPERHRNHETRCRFCVSCALYSAPELSTPNEGFCDQKAINCPLNPASQANAIFSPAFKLHTILQHPFSHNHESRTGGFIFKVSVYGDKRKGFMLVLGGNVAWEDEQATDLGERVRNYDAAGWEPTDLENGKSPPLPQDENSAGPLDFTQSYSSQEELPSKPTDQLYPDAQNRTEHADIAFSPFEDTWIPLSDGPTTVTDKNISIKRPFDFLRRAAALFGNSPWLLFAQPDNRNEFGVITYQQGHELAVSIGASLDSMVPNSQLPQRDGVHESLRLVGTWATNSVELLLSDFGAAAYGLTVVPMHPDMNARRFLEVMVHTQMTHLFADWQHLDMVLDLLEKGQLSSLSTVISLDAVGKHALQRAKALQLTVMDFWDLADSSNARVIPREALVCLRHSISNS
ncbi:uncharacterized protein LOC113146899 [Cyclospora cayetanensis]|uniref:Uncharacterized protein LOC113146899 n=1 Tax=Cyclospora cayetanensis TaxID=88456 RepID=A0A6P6RVA0_9EIME|nr:uncharacterized protein LOC113146899 [Cyclospora cayetanensis]